MKRMIDPSEVVQKPVLIHEEEIINNSGVVIKLDSGYYLIELHQKYASNIAFIHVGEEPNSISTNTLFNSGEVGTAIGNYHYDREGELLALYDGKEDLITLSGHIDIYKFKEE